LSWLTFFHGKLLALRKSGLSGFNVTTKLVLVETGVSGVDHLLKCTVLVHFSSDSETSGESIHGSDMTDEHVSEVSGFSSDFAVKVETTWGNTALSDDVLHALGALLDVHWELISVPTKKWITSVGIDTSKHSIFR